VTGRPLTLTRRRFIAAAGAGLGALWLPGCGQGGRSGEVEEQSAMLASGSLEYDGPPVELNYWTGFTGGDRPFMEDLVASFNADHPNISVAMNVVVWAEFYQKTPAAVRSGHGPDIGIMHVDQLATAAAHRTIVPLDGLAEVLGVQDGDFAPAAWDAGVFLGKRYGIPLDVHPLGMYYNKAVLEEAGLDPSAPPENREQFMAALEQMKSKGVRGFWVSPFLFTGGLMFQSLIPQFGGSLYNEDGTRATFGDEPGIEALRFMRSVIDEGYSAADVGQDAEAIAFKNGQNAFVWTGCWSINEYASTPGLEWGAAPLPVIGEQPGASAGSHQFVVMAQPSPDENKMRASRAFIDWMSQRSFEWAESGMVPARIEVVESQEFADLEAQQAFAAEIPYLVFGPSLPGIEDVRRTTLDLAIQKAVLGQASPEEALASAASQADVLLEENRQKYEGV
jgi:multiple sugar transport system substrate-binding protein